MYFYQMNSFDDLHVDVRQWFPNRAILYPMRLGSVWRDFCLSQLGGSYWHLVVQVKEAAKHPTRHRAASTRKNNLTLKALVPS